MFGLNKKNTKDDSPQDVVMEMETMENDLAGEKPERENVSLKSPLSVSIKKKPIIAVEPIDKMTRSPFINQPPKNATALSGRFLPQTEKGAGDESVLLPKKNNSQERKIPVAEKKDPRLESVISDQMPQFKIAPNERGEKLKISNEKTAPAEATGKKDFGKFLNKDKNTEAPRYTQGTNWGLIIVAIVIFIIAISSGAYYYFFVLKQAPSESSLNQSTPNQEAVELAQSSDEIVETTRATLPTPLEETDPLEIKEQNLLKTLSTIPPEEINLEEGRIYEAEEGQSALDANSILSSLGISLSDNIKGSLGRGWIFARKLDGQSLRLGLILEIKNTTSVTDIRAEILTGEKTLPTALDNLYIEDQLPILDGQSIDFSDSSVDSAFRYFNFYPDKTIPSTDWGIKTYETEDGTGSFLILSTSMETTRAIVTALEQ